MKFTPFALLALGVTSTSAIALFDVPACARTCAMSLPLECSNNPQCICSDKAWLANASCCVEKACSPQGLKTTFDFANEVCGYVGVKIGRPVCAATAPVVGGGKGGKNATAVE